MEHLDLWNKTIFISVSDLTLADRGTIECFIENDTSVISNISVALTVDSKYIQFTETG